MTAPPPSPYTRALNAAHPKMWGSRPTAAGAAVPTFQYPDHFVYEYKMGVNNTIASRTPVNGRPTQFTDYHGIYVDFFQEVAMHAGFTIEWQWTSNGSRTTYSSSWTACVADVRQGLLDVCVGNFWVTPARLRMARCVQFPSAILGQLHGAKVLHQRWVS